jgi:hypothetical protein
MGRLRDFRRDAAYYFGIGEGSPRVRDTDTSEETVLGTVVGVGTVLVVAAVLRSVLGFDSDLVGFLLTLGLVVALSALWGLAVLLARRRRP